MPTTEDPNAERDRWVELHKRDDESVEAARLRFWKENPAAVQKARTAEPAPAVETLTFGEMVQKRLDAYARRVQRDGEIEGRWGYLSTPRAEKRAQIKSAWWDSPDGRIVKQALREKKTPNLEAETVVKSRDEVAEALATLDR